MVLVNDDNADNYTNIKFLVGFINNHLILQKKIEKRGIK
jgi:hypothetical protein